MGTAREAIEARLESKKQAKAKKTTSKDSKAKKEKAKKAKAKTEKENKAPAGTANGKKAGAKKARKKAVMKWSSKENHIYTDNLLTLIEDKPRYAQAFGFTTKGDSAKNVSSSGQRPSDMYDEIARALFIEPEGSTFDEDDLKQLSNAVKNRVSSLKSGFRTQRDALGQTGQGLVHGGKESEITPGSDLANVWGDVQTKFPWYKRMHALYGKSPVVDRSAVANSQTPIDASSLKRCSSGNMEDDDDGNGSSSSDSGSGSSSESDSSESESDDESDHHDPKSSSPVKAPVSKKSAVPPVLVSRGIKRKGVVVDGDTVRQGLEISSQNRKDSVRIKEKERTARETKKAKLRHEIEMRRIDVQADEAAAQRAHELAMIERQIQLEQLRGGGRASGSQAGPSRLPMGAPDHYSLPPNPPGFAFDPNLQ